MKLLGDTEVTLTKKAAREGEQTSRVDITIGKIEIRSRSDDHRTTKFGSTGGRNEYSDEQYEIRWEEAERFVDLIAGQSDPVMTSDI